MAKSLQVFTVSLENFPVDPWKSLFQKWEERWTKIETDGGIVVDNVKDFSFSVHNPGIAVRPVAFIGDPLVPVVEGPGALLCFNRFKPGILSRRLIEVAVNRYKGVFHISPGISSMLRGRSRLDINVIGRWGDRVIGGVKNYSFSPITDLPISLLF